MRRKAPRRGLDEFCEGYRQAAAALKEKAKIPLLLGTHQEKGFRDSCGGVGRRVCSSDNTPLPHLLLLHDFVSRPMKNLAPQIFRQRLLMEGLFSIRLDQQALAAYMTGLAGHLGLRAYGLPAIYSPSGLGKEENQGYDAFLPLIDSGIAAYVWSSAHFFSIVIYTCARFNVDAAVQFTQEFFAATEVATMEF